MQKKIKFAQVSIEYLIVVGFVTFTIIAILGIAFFYSGTIKDRIKATQISNFANKIISTSESVFYVGKPSKATINAYLPDNVKEIVITDDTLYITFQTHSGENRIAFSSNVPISGALSSSQGLKKIQVEVKENYAQENYVNVSIAS